MRMTRLDLLRYGKFTDKTVTLPQAAQDFHLIVGPNEAGKSTLRSAIQDLLFGIETRSRYNFLHAHADMRLGALIEQGGDSLDFVRTKARSKTLQTNTGKFLPDTALVPYLGQVDRDFFDQMFGLNHERLVKGGQDILSASNDIGQILFQAATGVGSLGQIRDKLEAEANSLWAKRKSNDREVYLAAAELEQAEAALKAATVRTKDWQQASAQVNQISANLDQARQHYQALEQTRFGLERVRRTAPMLNQLKTLELSLAELGPVVVMPEDAAELLTRAEHDMALATQSAQLFEKQSDDLAEKMATLQPDASVLARNDDIEALFEQRQQFRSLDSDIAKREGEIQVLWQEVQASVRQLGWPDDNQEVVVARLPGALLQSSLGHLIRRHEALVQALANSEEALVSRLEEVKTIDLHMAALPPADSSVALVDALALARSLGDVPAQDKQIQTQTTRLKRDLDAARHELGPWCHAPDTLQRLLAPTQDETQALIKQRGDLEAKTTAGQQRIFELQADIDRQQLEIAQYKAAHQPVTLADVKLLRTQRDTSWQAIKRGHVGLQEAAPAFENQVAEADALSDQRHDRAQQATEFQLKLDQLQRLQHQMTVLTARQQHDDDALQSFDQVWSRQMDTTGLPAMPLLKVNGWRAARDRVLVAAAALAEALAAQRSLAERATQASTTLADLLPALPPQTAAPKLSVLVLLADERVNTATRTQERRDALLLQKIGAEAALAELTSRRVKAQSAMRAWQADFQQNLARAYLPESTPVEAAHDAITLFGRVQGQLQKIRDIRVNRIEAMRLALNDFDQQAKQLATAIAPDLAHLPSAQIALALNQGLKTALAVSQELNRVTQAMAQLASQRDAATAQLASSQASLLPLLRQSAAHDIDALRTAIDRSDRARLLTSQRDQTVTQLLDVGDGLTRELLEAAFQAADMAGVAAQLVELKRQIDEVVARQNALSAELNAAQAALEKIAGQADAARAEAQRQEALARMTNAVERFVRVHTAARLLRWSIERFRENQQGPMLRSASKVFLDLTLGAFCKLTVDYESEPLKLSGQRASGELVAIEGMSEGTRDQLYLALRLAALQLQLQQTVALPFIADDLFINYDDERARAGLLALGQLSESTQVIFLSHHAHLVPVARSVFGERLNVLDLG